MTDGPPTRRGGVPARPVAVAVVLHLVFSAVVVAADPLEMGAALHTGSRVAGGATAALQALLLVGLYRWPRTALVLYCGVAVAQTVTGLPRAGVGWVAAAYLLVRHGVPRALLVLGSTTVLTVAPTAFALGDGPVDVLMIWTVDTLIVGVQLALAAGTGAAVRAQERRARQRAEEGSRRRHELALAAERQRITDELHGVVVVGLQRLVAATTGLSNRLGEDADGVLAQVQDRAREALAAMRRTLVVLRAEQSPTDPPAPPAAARVFPRPTRSGCVVVGLLLAVMAAMGLVAGVIPPGAPDAVVAVLAPWRAGPQAVAFLVVQAAALTWWRSAPVAAFAATTVGAAGAAVWGGSSMVLDLAWFLPAWQTVVVVGPVWSALALAAAQALLVLAALGVGPWPTSVLNGEMDPVVLVVSNLGLVGLVWGMAWSWRTRSLRRAAARTRADDHRTRELVARERHRIARELHDVVAHLVSAVAVQAGAARAVAGHDPSAAREAVRHIEEQGERVRAALPELADLSTVGEIVPLTRDGVERLLAPVRAAGVPVTAHVVGEPAAAPGEAGLFAQRILTEALTNILRHAGRSPTHVAVEHGPGRVAVTVVDEGPRSAVPHTGGAGLGLVGMRERTRLLGGELSAGPTPAGGWSVRARLPLAPGLPLEEEAAGRTAPAGTRPRAEVAGPAVP